MPGVELTALGAETAPVGTDIAYIVTDVGGTPTSEKITLDDLKAFYNPFWFIRADVDRNLPNNTSLNALFNDPANGRFTLPTGLYFFEGTIYITTMSATSGNALFNILGAGTATASDWLWHAWGIDATSPLATSTQTGSFSVTANSPASVVSAGTGTSLAFSFQGNVNITGAGTLIPSIDLVTANAAVLKAGSIFSIIRMDASGTIARGPVD